MDDSIQGHTKMLQVPSIIAVGPIVTDEKLT